MRLIAQEKIDDVLAEVEAIGGDLLSAEEWMDLAQDQSSLRSSARQMLHAAIGAAVVVNAAVSVPTSFIHTPTLQVFREYLECGFGCSGRPWRLLMHSLGEPAVLYTLERLPPDCYAHTALSSGANPILKERTCRDETVWNLVLSVDCFSSLTWPALDDNIRALVAAARQLYPDVLFPGEFIRGRETIGPGFVLLHRQDEICDQHSIAMDALPLDDIQQLTEDVQHETHPVTSSAHADAAKALPTEYSRGRSLDRDKFGMIRAGWV